MTWSLQRASHPAAVAVIGTGGVALGGLLGRSFANTRCATIYENVAGERCYRLQEHAGWFFVPAAVALPLLLVTLRSYRRLKVGRARCSGP